MRRLASIAAFALFLSIPVWAQHGGSHVGGGHSSFSGGHAGGFAGHSSFSGGHIGGGHFSSGTHAGGMHSRGSRGFSHSSNRSFSRSPFLHNGFHRGFRGRGFRDGRFGYRYPWWNTGYYDPWLWDWSDAGSSYDEDYERDRATAIEMNEQSL